MSLFSFQGEVFLASRDPNGKPISIVKVGNVPTLQITLNQDTDTKNESQSGQHFQIGLLSKSKTATIAGSFDEWIKENLGIGFYATPLAVEDGTVTHEAFPTGLVVGDYVMLDKPGVSDLVITDSAVTPATVPPTKYSTSYAGSMVKIEDLAGSMPPWFAAYSYKAHMNLAMFTTPAPERYLILDGTNTETGNPARIELYRVRFNPFTSLDAINDGYGTLPFTASILADLNQVNDPVLGPFGRLLTVDG